MALAGSLHTAVVLNGVISGVELVRVFLECLSWPRDFGAIMGGLSRSPTGIWSQWCC